jgi:hypothetical protein
MAQTLRSTRGDANLAQGCCNLKRRPKRETAKGLHCCHKWDGEGGGIPERGGG